VSETSRIDENEPFSVAIPADPADGWPLPEGFGEASYHLQVEAVLGPAGADLAGASHQAHAQLREALGEGGFEVLDRYVSAVTAAACAREEAVAAVCYAQGLGASRAGDHAALAVAVVGALLASGLPPATATQVACEAMSAVSAALRSAE